MKKPIRIAISGKIASGKTTTSDYLINEHGFVRYNFAKYVKGLAGAIADLNYLDSLDDDEKKDSVKSLSEALNGLYDILTLISKDVDEFQLASTYLAKIKDEFKDVTDTSIKNDRVRALMQAVGNGFTENVRADIWADITIKEMENNNPNDNIVIDDLRYPHEIDLLKETGFMIVRLEVNEEERLERISKLYKGITETHLRDRSERALDRFVYHGIRAFTLKDMKLEDTKAFLNDLINEED